MLRDSQCDPEVKVHFQGVLDFYSFVPPENCSASWNGTAAYERLIYDPQVRLHRICIHGYRFLIAVGLHYRWCGLTGTCRRRKPSHIVQITGLPKQRKNYILTIRCTASSGTWYAEWSLLSLFALLFVYAGKIYVGYANDGNRLEAFLHN